MKAPLLRSDADAAARESHPPGLLLRVGRKEQP
jgi:hypothetical protein